jgi:sugar phosphate isomerase/epimerase
MNIKRRLFTQRLGLGAIGLYAGTSTLLSACGTKTDSENSAEEGTTAGTAEEAAAPLFFSISLAQWSLHRSYFGGRPDWQSFRDALMNDPSSIIQGDLDPMDFAGLARREFDISGVEYVNTFYYDKAENTEYLSQLKQRADDNGVQSVLIMCDALGNLGDADEAARIAAVENHYKWVNAAKYLGCHSIRVNAAGQGTAEEVAAAAVDGLGRLAEYGAQEGINIIVENHGGYSSDGGWLSGVMKQVNNEYCGTLPDFGNFCIEYGDGACNNMYDRYKGTTELMPFAKGVSAKANVFDENGNETNTDYKRMMQIVKDAGYTGFVGIEYEGEIDEFEGIRATKALLEKVGQELS